METSPLEWTLVFLVIVVPVLGATARFALSPIVEAILRLQQAFAPPLDASQLGDRVREMAQEIRVLQTEVDRLSEVWSFHESILVDGPAHEPKHVPPPRESERLDQSI